MKTYIHHSLSRGGLNRQQNTVILPETVFIYQVKGNKDKYNVHSIAKFIHHELYNEV